MRRWVGASWHGSLALAMEQPEQPRNAGLEGEAVGDAKAGGRPEVVAKVRLPDQTLQAIREAGDVARLDQKALDAVAHEFRYAGEPRRQDRQRLRGGFHDDVRQA